MYKILAGLNIIHCKMMVVFIVYHNKTNISDAIFSMIQCNVMLYSLVYNYVVKLNA